VINLHKRTLALPITSIACLTCPGNSLDLRSRHETY
jgi:hypothetical protein